MVWLSIQHTMLEAPSLNSDQSSYLGIKAGTNDWMTSPSHSRWVDGALKSTGKGSILVLLNDRRKGDSEERNEHRSFNKTNS